MTAVLGFTVAAFAVLVPVAAQDRQTEHTLALTPGAPRERASLSEMAWLAGHWRGEGLGGVVEEMWTAPEGGAMVGSFRLIRDGKPVFYELMTLVEDGGTVVLRLKHFDADLTGWEEKDRTVDFPFVARAGARFHFAGLTFEPEGDRLTVYVAIRHRDGDVREEAFRYRRVAETGAR